MKERGLLFSGPMVRAILEGRKTQTRRAMATQPSPYVPTPNRHPAKRVAPYFDAYNGGPFWCWWSPDDRQGPDWIRCPFGVPGDRLWVRETFQIESNRGIDDYTPPFSDGRPARHHKDDPLDGWGDWWEQPHYRATDPEPELAYERCAHDHDGPCSHWTPSIHMPRWASRITLEITEVRCERLQDISEEDAKAEGVTVDHQPGKVNGEPATLYPMTHAMAFTWLWDAINGKTAPWSSNPWVWALTFVRVKP